MADITMCSGESLDSMRVRCICPIRDDCYRYKAKPSPRQSYFMTAPNVYGDCDEYIPDKQPPIKKPSK